MVSIRMAILRGQESQQLSFPDLNALYEQKE